MIVIFFDHEGVTYQYAVPSKITVNSGYYISMLGILWQQTWRKCHELVGNCPLHHGNARLHVETSVQQYLNKCYIKIMPYPSYGSNLILCNF